MDFVYFTKKQSHFIHSRLFAGWCWLVKTGNYTKNGNPSACSNIVVMMQNWVIKMSPKRIQILKLTLLLVVGSSGQNVDYEDVTERCIILPNFFVMLPMIIIWRLGLLGPSLGLHPTGGVLADMKNDTKPSESSELSESSEPAPLLALLDPFATTQQCCCFSISESCPSLFGIMKMWNHDNWLLRMEFNARKKSLNWQHSDISSTDIKILQVCSYSYKLNKYY